MNHRKKPARKSATPGRRRHRPAAEIREPGWKVVRTSGISILQSSALARKPWLVHCFSTRPGGTSLLKRKRVLNLGNTDWDTKEAVAENRTRLLAALGAEKMSLVELRQCHTDQVHVVNAPPSQAVCADALLTSRPGLLLAIKTADCVPILLADSEPLAVAAVHAGWRGTLARIVQKALGRMQMEFGTRPENIVAVLGPAIGRCCYEVGPEVAQAFAAQFETARDWFDGPFEKVIRDDSPNPLKWLQRTPPGHDSSPPRVQLDLPAANRWQLEQLGVRAKNIFASDLCTACRRDLLFSHRREQGKTGRMMGLIGIRSR